MKVSQSSDVNQNRAPQNRVKQEIKIMLQNKQSDYNAASSTYRSGETSDADGSQLNSDRSHHKLLIKPRKFSINSTTIEKNNLQSLIDPIINKKNIQNPIKFLLNSPSSISYNANQNSALQTPPFPGNNQSVQQGLVKHSERSINDHNLTKNNYQEYIQNEGDNSKQSSGISSSVLNNSRDVSEKNLKIKSKDRVVKTERNSIIEIENYNLENNHFYNTKKTRNNSFKENPNYESYQNQLLAYSMQKATNPKINPDYFTLAKQVCKNQKMMKLKHTHYPTTASTGESPRRNSKNNINDMISTYKQTVNKLINDRKELNKSRVKLFSQTNTISFNRISQYNTPFGSQQAITMNQQLDQNLQNQQSSPNTLNNPQSIESFNFKNQSQISNFQSLQQQNQMQKQQSYNYNLIQISSQQTQNTFPNEFTSNTNSPQKQQSSNFARFALDQIQDENQQQQKIDNDNLMISNFNRENKMYSQNGNSVLNTPRSNRPFTNSQKRNQRQQQQLQREYFSSLFEDTYKNESIQKFVRITSVNQQDKIDHKSENIKKNEINQLKRKEISQIKKLSQQLIENGKVNAQEQELLESKLKIQKFFLQKDISLNHKKQCFKKLITEFNPSNQKYSQQNSSQITKMLTIMKPFYFNEANNPSQNLFSNQIKQQNKEARKDQVFKQSQTISSFANSEQNFISQLTTFYNSKQNDLYQINSQNQQKIAKFKSNPNLLNHKSFNHTSTSTKD